MNISVQPAYSRAAGLPDEVGPSRPMEIGLHVLVSALLCVSIIGITFVYGFNLDSGSILDNISALVRALGVDGGFFLGLYFSRRLWMRKKQGWWDGLKTTLFGLIWFAVALLMATLSWFSNTLFVASFQAIITQELLAKAGFTSIDPTAVNKVIGAIPLVIVLLYSIVPRHQRAQIEARTPAEIEEEAKREAARIRAQNMVAAARAEGAGARLRTVVGGLVGQAFNLEETHKREERIKQMRIALETAGLDTATLSDEQVEIQAMARGVWDQKRDEAVKPKPAEKPPAPTWHPEGGWMPMEGVPAQGVRETNDAPVAHGTPAEDAMTIDELAGELNVSRGTITYWMRPDFAGATKIKPEEVIALPDGSRRILASVLWRLRRAQHAKGSGHKPGDKPGKSSRTPLDRTPAATPATQTNGNGDLHPTNPLALPKLEGEPEQNIQNKT